MKRRARFDRAPLLALVAMLVICPCLAAHDLGQDEALHLRQTGAIQPLEQLMQAAMARYPKATLLEAELEREDGILRYEIELLTQEGIVRELELDAKDGRILKDKEDH